MRWAWLCVIGYTWRGQGPQGDSLAGSLRPQTAAVKWKGHGGIMEEECRGPQSLSTNVLLMSRCEGHQEHGLNEAFIVASVYNNVSPFLSSDTHIYSWR